VPADAGVNRSVIKLKARRPAIYFERHRHELAGSINPAATRPTLPDWGGSHGCRVSLARQPCC
jgi:hypothetical protein